MRDIFAHILYHLGDLVSKLMYVDLPERFYPYGTIYSLYSWLMINSIKYDDHGKVWLDR